MLRGMKHRVDALLAGNLDGAGGQSGVQVGVIRAFRLQVFRGRMRRRNERFPRGDGAARDLRRRHGGGNL